MMLLAAAVLQASAALFAPPEAVPLRVTSERIEGARRYTMERLVRFARESGGWRAEVLLLHADSDTGEASGALFEAGFGSLAGRVIVFHLDAAGRVRGIEDMAALWERFSTHVAEIAASRRSLAPADRAVLAGRIAAPLRALPPARRQAMLASLIDALVAEREELPTGVRPVRLPATSPFGGTVTLQGSRAVTTIPGGLVRSETRAAAETAAPAAGGSGRVEVALIDEIDPRTGLIATSSSTTRTRTRSDGGEARETVRITTLKVEKAAPESWQVL